MRFHLVDRIDELVPRTSVRAVKATSGAEAYWQGDPPVMLPALVLEAVCQAGTWLVMGSTDLTRRAVLVSVGRVRTHALVRPGQRLELTGTVRGWGEEAAVLDGRVQADGRLVLVAEDVLCALRPAESLQDAQDARRLFETLVRS